jgi:15-cis-phytoene synthase
MTDCRAIMKHHGKSFALASVVLPGVERDEVAALYAWCRRADDAIDCGGAGTGAPALCRLERELSSVYTGESQEDPVLAAFQRVIRARRIPAEYPRLLLEGLALDVRNTRYRTSDELLHYCFLVAGTVGLMMCHLLGISDERARRRAAHLGIAMQLTNICRDVREDWENGRLYLPADLLSVEGAEELAAGQGDPFDKAARGAIGRVVGRLLGLAERYYLSADAGLEFLPWRARLAVASARFLYSAIGARIESMGWDVLAGRAVVSRVRKLLLVGRAFARAARGGSVRRRRFRRARLDFPVRFSDVVRL